MYHLIQCNNLQLDKKQCKYISIKIIVICTRYVHKIILKVGIYISTKMKFGSNLDFLKEQCKLAN